MNSKIILAKGINIDRDYNNVINYTENQMLTLLHTTAHFVNEKNNYSFIKDTGKIDTQFSYSEVLNSNYMAFQNPNYSNKWFFAWIDEVEYRGNYNTRISFTVDAWSTWFNTLTVKKCFVKRHHVNDDAIGLNRVPENLAINNIIELAETEDTSLGQYYYVAMQTDWLINNGSTHVGLDQGKQFAGISVYNKQISGHEIILFGKFTGTITEQDTSENNRYKYIYNYIQHTLGDGHIEDIKNLFIIPASLITEANLTLNTIYVNADDATTKSEFYTFPYSIGAESTNYTIPKVTSFSDYTPKNNKCFCYPLNYLFVTNNNGSNNIFKYEDFYNSVNATFSLYLALTIGVSGKLVPTNYKGQTTGDFDNGLSLGKYPVCSWTSDAFINWLTSQAWNLATSWLPRRNFC